MSSARPGPGTAGSAETPEARADRLARRRRLLLVVLPFAVIALLVLTKAVSMTVINEAGRSAYASGSIDRAGEQFEKLAPANVLSPWVAWNNRGTAQFGQAAYDVAETDFRRALELVPRRHACIVVVNLASTLERIGDDLTVTGDPVGAQQRYTEALGLIERYACPDDEQTGDNAQQTEQRLREKLTEPSTPTPTPSPSPSPSTSGSPTPTPSEDPQAEQRRRDEQERRNADAQRTRNTDRQRQSGSGDESGSGNERVDQPW